MQIERGNPFPFGPTSLPDGMNFALYAINVENISLCFFKENEYDHPFEEIRLDPNIHKTGDVWHALIKGLPPIFAYVYKIKFPGEDNLKPILDPYVKYIVSDPKWHDDARKEYYYKPLGKIAPTAFNWDGDKQLNKPKKDLIIYEMHVRGFTRHSSSQVSAPGTFQGIIEKIPYLLDLGVNAIELMPIQEFNEEDVMHFNPDTEKKLHNYFGYSTVNFFAPMNRYASHTRENDTINEFKNMVKELHKNGIEVILDIVFNHTAEGNENGPILSFKGMNPHAFYFINNENKYMNYSGCGNSVNGNHPITKEFIIDVLRYWVIEMHVDGFRFDLASELTRGLDHAPLDNPPLIEFMTHDPILANTKLIAEPWDPGGLYQLGKFAFYGSRWSEWNGKYQSIVRAFIKGTPGQKNAFAGAICGSRDVYANSSYSSVNYITAHDGFSLADLVSYNEKHNLPNGENNADGNSDNNSWNCGLEGEVKNNKVLNLRKKQMRNLIFTLMISEGIPMILMGDEYGHTRHGNNNPWGQDNEINWFLWNKLKENHDLYSFFRFLIHFRKNNALLHAESVLTEKERQWHGSQPNQPDWENEQHLVAFSLHDPDGKPSLYIAFNSSHVYQNIVLPSAGEGNTWKWIVNTSNTSNETFYDDTKTQKVIDNNYRLPPYSAIMLQTCPI